MQQLKRTPASTVSSRIDRSMSTTTARNAVFDTIELLEEILVRLPFKNLFLVQRVSRRFQEVITTSFQIQQKMFLRQREREKSWMLRSTVPINQYQRRGQTFELLVPASKDVTNRLQTFGVTTMCPLFESPLRSGSQSACARLSAMRSEYAGLDSLKSSYSDEVRGATST